ncbi:DUF4253 domain-containing protein [Maribacter sp. 4G9]|uniref:DUF4253 domain-containing protein n=1 Tax=Maribacter sp. 4G9 TaxID=1889777 RepID=UPI000C1577B2|nr:DUF4253 domain-containing protein [Maribacter sp. 4G9]PIB38338.1 hypothetical protein BFP75_17310 [Maribacter sp. 4G9]
MNNIIILFFLSISLTSCNGFSQQKSSADKKVKIVSNLSEADKNGLNISSQLLVEIQSKTKKKPQPLKWEIWKYGREGNEENYIIDKGVFFGFIDESTAHDIFRTYREQVVSEGNYLFLTKMDFDDSYNTYYDVVILECKNQFELVKLIGTDGINYDVYNDEIINKLEDWNNEIGFEIVVVDAARVHAYMGNLPADINSFAKDVYDFCPDVIDQGYSSMEEMITDYQNNRYFWLWWD